MEPAQPAVVLVILAVADVARATAFYRTALAFAQLVDAPVYAELQVAPCLRLGLYQKDGFARNLGGERPASTPPGAVTATELYLHVPDPAAASAALLAAGGRLLSPLAVREWGDEAAYHSDPDGNVVVVARPVGERKSA